mmetsp:Transcript_18011/g.37693  ORF Transcript_18011/g.37693 Transcript_18011/m.37693 type:complete len:231 (-) Transcript_18011:2491-3183(-)
MLTAVEVAVTSSGSRTSFLSVTSSAVTNGKEVNRRSGGTDIGMRSVAGVEAGNEVEAPLPVFGSTIPCTVSMCNARASSSAIGSVEHMQSGCKHHAYVDVSRESCSEDSGGTGGASDIEAVESPDAAGVRAPGISMMATPGPVFAGGTPPALPLAEDAVASRLFAAKSPAAPAAAKGMTSEITSSSSPIVLPSMLSNRAAARSSSAFTSSISSSSSVPPFSSTCGSSRGW